MLLPDFNRVIYEKNPLVEVICQLRFPTILRIGAGAPDRFQDMIRKEYPLYRLREPTIEFPGLPKELATIVDQLPLPKLPGSATHRFSTKNSQRFISLSQDFLALTESDYTRWELFRAEIEKAERSLREAYEPAFYSRVGLRYRDMISRRRLGLSNAKWSDLLQPHIVAELGSPAIMDAIEATHTQSVIRMPEIPGGRVRLIHGLGKLPESDEECYVFDADFSVEHKEGINEPFDILDRFNRLAWRLFRWAITDTLHGAMQPKSI